MQSLFSHSLNHGADLSRSPKIRNHSAPARVFGRGVLAAVFCVLPLISATSFAADTPSAAVAYRPGDTVRVFVTFKEPISLKGALVRFGLQGELPEGQKVFIQMFDAGTPIKLSEREYEFQAKIGEYVASGTYQLSFINATDEADLTRGFAAGRDFPMITVCVRNDKHVAFPEIKTVRVGEPEVGRP